MLHWLRRPAEEPMWASLRSLSRYFTPGGIIDIGAHEGVWARKAAEIFDCPIHMIEARPSAERFMKAAGHTYTIALLGREPKTSVPFSDYESGSSVFTEVTGFPEKVITLPQKRLDDLNIFSANAPLLIKLDVQGYELEVL